MPKEYTLIGGNGTRVSPLEVNESGTYEAGDSRAFNPVKVNVPSGSSTLSGLTDVDISNPTDGQTLVYNAESGKWKNGAGGGGIYMLDTGNLDTMAFDGQSYEYFYYDDLTYKFKLVDPSVISHFQLAVIKTITDGSPYLAPAPVFVYTIPAQDPATVSNSVFCNTAEITAVMVMGDKDEYALIPANGSYAPGTSH